jgi:hypothetical protein
MFSIADIQAEEEPDFENPEEGEGAEDPAVHGYPIRVSLSLTKVVDIELSHTDKQWLMNNDASV